MQEQQIRMKERSAESPSYLEEGEKMEKYLDPTLWHWWFFLRGRAFQDVTQQNGSFSKRDRHWEVFKSALEGALSHTGTVKTALNFPITEDPTNRHPYPSSFARVPRDPTQNIKMSMHALSLLDSTYIRFAWTQSGRTDSEAFKNLRYKDWQYSESDTVFLGDATCLTAEIEKPEDTSGRFSLAEEMSRQILSDWHGVSVIAEKPFEIDLVEVACGFFATVTECDEVVWALLVWNDDEARRQAVRFINKITPPFMLAWLKARYIKREYKDKVAPEAYKAEIALEAMLNRQTKETKRLKALEEFTLLSSEPLGELSRQIDISEERQFTLKINKENLENLIKDPVFGLGGASMDPLVIAPIRSSMDQINTDLGYRTLLQKRAYEVRKDSNVIAGILTNRWTRRITIVLGVFAIFGVVQAFDVELTDLGKLYPLTTFVAGLASWNQVWPKVAAVLLGFVILAIIIKLLSRNE